MTTIMDEKKELIEQDSHRRIYQMEHDLLYHGKSGLSEANPPRSFGMDTQTFLLGYLIVCLGMALYSSMNTFGKEIFYYYAINAFFSAIGTYGVVHGNPRCLFFYGGFYTASLIFGAVIGGSLAVLLWQPELAEVLGQVGLPDDVVAIAREYPVAFPVVGTAIVVAELGLEVYILRQLKKTYDWLSKTEMDDYYDEEAAIKI